MDSIRDPLEKRSTIGIINNFGQTPRRIFTKAHPARGGNLDVGMRIHVKPDGLCRSWVALKCKKIKLRVKQDVYY